MSYAALLIASLVLGADSAASGERTSHELRQAVHAALRASAPSARSDAVVVVPQLVALFDEVGDHPAMIRTDRVRYQGLLKARLRALAKDLRKDLPETRPAHVQLPADRDGPANNILAQQAGNRPRPAVTNFNANPNAAQNTDVTSANAQQLIDLIERTIAPTTWERAGGLGTIRYYRPLRALVVRQTGDVHEQLGGLIGGLNK